MVNQNRIYILNLNLINIGRFTIKEKYKDKPILFYDWFIRHIQPEYPNPIYRNGLFAIRKDILKNQ